MSAVYVVGAPGIGKSAVVEALTAEWVASEFERPAGYSPFGYEILRAGDRTPVGAYLGRHRGHSSGTDTLPLNALPAAVRWATQVEDLPARIYGEGHRLGHVRFLAALHARTRLLVVHLTAPDEVVAARRRAERAAAWVRGATTRGRRLSGELQAAGVPLLTVWATGDLPSVVRAVRDGIHDRGLDNG